MAEQTVAIASKLYAARRAAKSLLAEKYGERIAEFQEIIRTVATREGLDEMHATMELVKGMQSRGDSGIAQMLFLAAYVELVEPSP